MGTTQNTAAIYVRRSAADERDTDDSDNRSHARQERDCEALAERHGLTVVEVYREKVGTSASHLTTNRRPQLERALTDFGSRFSTLIVWSVDRQSRKGLAEAGHMIDRLDQINGRLITCCGLDSETQGDEFELLFGIKASLAKSEIKRMSKRIRGGKEEQRIRGEHQGGRLPFGLVRDHDAEYGVSLDHDAVDILWKGADLVIAGASLREACAALNSAGHRTSSGSLWRAETLRRILRAPHMLGHRYYGSQDTYAVDDDGNRLVVHEPILTEAQFRRFTKSCSGRVRTTDNLKRSQDTAKRYSSLLGGLLHCEGCGSSLASQRKRMTRGEKEYTYRDYRCPSCLPGHTVPGHELDEHVARSALLFLAKIAALDPESPIVEEVGRRWLARFTPDQVNRHDELRDEIDAVEGRHRELQANYYERRTMDTDLYERLDRKLAGEIADLRDELRDTPAPRADLAPLWDLTQSADTDDIVGPGSAWGNLPHHERREIIRVLIDQVTITRSDDRHDIVGRSTIEFATESNVIDLANRSEQIRSKHLNLKVKTA